MIPTKQLVRGFEDRNQKLYVRATLVEIPDGQVVECVSDERPTRREIYQGWMLVASVVVLALFMGWLVVP